MLLSGGLSHIKTLALLFLDISYFENSVDPYKLASADQDLDTDFQGNLQLKLEIQCKQTTATEVHVA